MKTAFITGITGFVGSHLAEFLLTKNYRVFGLVRARSNLENIKHLSNKIRLITGDVTDAISLRKALSECKPDEVYHLAANSYVPYSWTQPVEVFNTNAIGFINLLEAIRNFNLNPKIMIAGSSEEYGMVYEEEVPIKETNPLRPLSPYGVSKVTMDLLAQQYFASYKMNIFISRAFNHTGPKRGENFVCSNFAKQIVKIEMGLKDKLTHGDLSSVRDFTDVRDMVKAYVIGLNHPNIEFGKPYNIASGKGYTIQEIVDMLCSMSKKEIELEMDEARTRPSDVPLLIGDSTSFRETTGWKPEIPFEQTLKDLLTFWRKKLKKP